MRYTLFQLLMLKQLQTQLLRRILLGSGVRYGEAANAW